MNLETLVAFVFGFLVCAFLFFSFGDDLEVPLVTGLSVFEADKVFPSDFVSNKDIIVLDDRVILKIDGASLSSYADSGSMVPVLGKGANGIRIVPKKEEDIEVGDIVSFRVAYELDDFFEESFVELGVLVVHRVVEKGVDEDGVWFAVKGDSNLIGDGIIRFEDIEYKTIGIFY